MSTLAQERATAIVSPRGVYLCGLIVALLTVLASCDGRLGSPTSPRGPSEWCLEQAVFGNPAESPFVLPYPVGESYELLQSYCTVPPRSHSSSVAYDFTMPMGAEVVAARGGDVSRVVDHFPDNGEEGTGMNHIRVRHSDGSEGLYYHLRRLSAEVRVGDRVTTGGLLARAGSSGTWTPCSTCAVLHFQVSEVGEAVNFRNTDGPLDDRGGLVEGELYTALPF